MNNCNLIIIKSISIYIIYVYSNFNKTLISITVYLTLKFLTNVITKSVKQVEYETHLIEELKKYTPHFKGWYLTLVKYIYTHAYTISSFGLRIFIRCFSSRPTLLFYSLKLLACVEILTYFVSISYVIEKILNLLNLKDILQYADIKELKKRYEIFKDTNYVYI